MDCCEHDNKNDSALEHQASVTKRTKPFNFLWLLGCAAIGLAVFFLLKLF